MLTAEASGSRRTDGQKTERKKEGQNFTGTPVCSERWLILIRNIKRLAIRVHLENRLM